MKLLETLLELCGFDQVESVEQLRVSWLASWADAGWIFFGVLACFAISFVFYSRFERRLRTRSRVVLACLRGALLSCVFLALAEPALTVTIIRNPKPILWMLFDGTESMSIRDRLPDRLPDRLGGRGGAESARSTSSDAVVEKSDAPTRTDRIRELLEDEDGAWVRSLEERFRLRPFLFSGASGVRTLTLEDEEGELDAATLAGQLSSDGEVTALGASFSELRRRHGSSGLAGVLVVSDFDQNSGPSPVEAAKRLGVPVHTLGVGPESAGDLSIDVQSSLVMKKAERSSVVVYVRQSGLEGTSARVRVVARRADRDDPSSETQELLADDEILADREVVLDRSSVAVDVLHTPEETGRFVLIAHVDPIEGEVLSANNTARREMTVRDDFLRLFFVEYEPTWEWRFIKEVFYRDKLVGQRGFRTFLRSADPKVRHAGGVFSPTLAPTRSEFFSNDVVFLGDMPATALSTRFCELCKEFVGKFGGGLVVIAGPRFGPSEIGETPLADMLPVIPKARSRLVDDREFRLELTADAGLVDFMQLGESAEENLDAWHNLGKLPWYQPVARLHSLGTALAVHPTEKCVDDETPQPLIAIRKYGKGEVVYVGFNETWRLRRRYRERYYRLFSGLIIHRLGLSHALGAQKRFVVRTDRTQYRSDDEVVVTVEAFDANFEPLEGEELEAQGLRAELVTPTKISRLDSPLESDGSGDEAASGEDVFRLTQLRTGVFQARVRVVEGGEHRIRVQDPETREWSEVHLQVARISAEKRSAVRNVVIEREITSQTGGRSYGLDTVGSLAEEIESARSNETSVEVFPLWNTWFAFLLVVSLMLFEWLLRKLARLP